MRWFSRSAGILTLSFLAACGGGGTKVSRIFQSPEDVAVSSTKVKFDGRTTRFAYVADPLGGHVVPIDVDKEQVVDTDDGDDFDFSPVAVGGEPVSIALQERTEGTRFFVADAFHRELLAFEGAPSDPENNVYEFEPVSLGGAPVGRASTPIFENRGDGSSPTLTDVDVDSALARNEHWEVKFLSDSKGYRVTGSVSGEQEGRAMEGKRYTTDDGALSFTVRGGGDLTTEKDIFRFGTTVLEPLALAGRPVDLTVSGDTLLVVESDPAGVEVVDLDTFAITALIPLTDGTGIDPQPSLSALAAGHLFVSNSASTTVFDVDTDLLSMTAQSVGFPTNAVGYDGETDTLHLLKAETPSDEVRARATFTKKKTLMLTEIPVSFASFVWGSKPYGLIGNVGGSVDVIDLKKLRRVDSHDDGGSVESDWFGEEFFDADPPSSPDLISVQVEDGVTVTERWQLIYEAIVPGAQGLDGTVAGNSINVAGATFLSWGVRAGDTVVLDPNGEAEEVTVSDVVSEEELELDSSPDAQGAQELEVRVSASYLVLGSVSGVQDARAVEGETYRSDTEAIVLTIRPSPQSPTSRGDFFTFLTVDGIDPILMPDKRHSSSIVSFTRPGKSEPTAYVVQKANAAISALDLDALKERTTLR